MVLFLDYDGPLHPDAVYRIRGKIVLKADGISLFEYAPILCDILRPHPEVRIVLSTSWVRVLGFDRARSYLSAELQQRVIGATYHSVMNEDAFSRLTRYEQIARYTRRHSTEHWIALDNDAEGWPESERYRLVHVDDWLGIFEKKAQQQLAQKLSRRD